MAASSGGRDRYGPLRGAADERALAEIIGGSFAFPPPDALTWFANAGREHVRALREGRDVVAGLLLLPMGQYFGGRSVPMTGIAAVAVAPHRRGRGAAAELMRCTLAELFAAGVPISALYPAALELYRSVGYEQAGSRFEIAVPVAELAARREPGLPEVRPMAPDDEPAIRRAYDAVARWAPGHLDRGAYIWNRVRTPRGERAHGYAAESARGVEGYVYLVQQKDEQLRFALRLTDFAATTPGAARALLRFLADHRSLATDVRFYSGPTPPLLHALAGQTYSITHHFYWCVRIVHLVKALAARGYPAGLDADIELDVSDDILPDNAGRWRLTVARGRGRVRRGGRGTVRLDVRALASLYTGHLTARSLAALGKVTGRDRDLARADAIFGGPAPSCPDMF